MCTETENKMSWQAKHLHFLDKYQSRLEHRKGPGERSEETFWLPRPCFRVLWGSGEQVGEVCQHPAPTEGSDKFWPAQVHAAASPESEDV